MIFASITITAQRSEVVDFTYPYMEEDMVIGITVPPTSYGMFYIFSGFQLNVWLAILTTIITVCVMMRLIQARIARDQSKISIDGHFVISFGAFVLQG